jgi:hypothetical protein
MTDTINHLKKVLNLSDLVLFGISSILGSGGFNLVGKAIQDGGKYFPLTLLLSGALFMGSAHSYSYAHDTFESNTSETKLIEKVFGSFGKYSSAISIMLYNIFATATILVFCSKLLFPEKSWLEQVSFALLLLSMMTFAAFQQLDLNKEIINIFSLLIILVLGSSTFLGVTKIVEEPFKMPSFPKEINLYEAKRLPINIQLKREKKYEDDRIYDPREKLHKKSKIRCYKFTRCVYFSEELFMIIGQARKRELFKQIEKLREVIENKLVQVKGLTQHMRKNNGKLRDYVESQLIEIDRQLVGVNPSLASILRWKSKLFLADSPWLIGLLFRVLRFGLG